MSIDFYVSTTAFRRMPIEQVMDRARQFGLALEFSSGIPFRADMREVFLQSDIKRLPHNYFPAPIDPFVLNLASTDAAIHARSIAHCIQGLELAAAAKAPFFSVHAGFCIDPKPSELGRQLSVDVHFERSSNWAMFLQAVRVLLSHANVLGVNLLIENNVLAPFNLPSSKKNPLLCATADECLELIGEISHPRLALLLDTGHLHVSAKTLGFDLDIAVKKLAPHVQALHHSDNDGVEDTNRPLSRSYWFLSWMPLYLGATHILEVHDQSVAAIAEQKALLENATS